MRANARLLSPTLSEKAGSYIASKARTIRMLSELALERYRPRARRALTPIPACVPANSIRKSNTKPKTQNPKHKTQNTFADSYSHNSSPPIRTANVKHECTMRMGNVKFQDFRALQQGKQESPKHPLKFPSQRKNSPGQRKLFSQSEKKFFLVRDKKRGQKALIKAQERDIENIIKIPHRTDLFE